MGTILNLLQFLVKKGLLPAALTDREWGLEALEDASSVTLLLSGQLVRVEYVSIRGVDQRCYLILKGLFSINHILNDLLLLVVKLIERHVHVSSLLLNNVIDCLLVHGEDLATLMQEFL